MRASGIGLLLIAIASLPGCATRQPSPENELPSPKSELEVTATAYNAMADQTKADDPTRAASGARLRPGMRVLAVSDDLYDLGLRFGTRVWIEGVEGDWRVEDRMASRWRRRIDLYFGDDRGAAERFGERRVRIRWEAP